MSKKTKILLVICCIIFFTGGILTYFSFFDNDNSNNFLRDLVNKVSPNRGSIDKNSITTKCNGKDIICTQKNGTIIAQKQKTEEKSCEKERNCHLVYSANERAAVSAIRAYTGVQDMNLMPFVKDSTPDNITYYCNDSNKCWAVNHKTHNVVEMK